MGGYVRLVGMFPPLEGTGPVRFAPTARAVSRAGRQCQSGGVVGASVPEDEGRLFYEKPFWQKLIIMASGPTMNILLAFLILLGVSRQLWRLSLPVDDQQGPGMHCRREHRRPELHRETADAGCAVRYPAGDKIVAFNGTPVSSWDDGLSSDSIESRPPGAADASSGRSAHRPEAGQYGHHRRTGQVQNLHRGAPPGSSVLNPRSYESAAARWPSSATCGR